MNIPAFIRRRLEQRAALDRRISTAAGYVDWRRVEAHYHVYRGANDPEQAFALAYEAALEEARKERAA